ncbi:MAG: insulinase family protein [Deltaproteobacteria bacterium]|jgi:zinc protease|nr:insulinase family protein [Deltaproteobacteria bacterium]
MAQNDAGAPDGASADTSFTLGNGLKVILAPQPGNRMVAALLTVKAGSSAEAGASEQGLAHLVEHMVFKGTARRKAGELSSEVERNGGDLDAFTDCDETSYGATLPSGRLGTALDVLSDMVFRPSFDPGEFAREKEVIIEEIKTASDLPQDELCEVFYGFAFGGDHPYGRRVLGTAESVAAIGRDAALAFHARFYRPDNCLLVIAGGFDPREARAEAGKYLAGAANPEGPLSRPAVPAPAADGPRVRVLRSPDVAVPKVIMGFFCPSASSPESPALDLLSSLLCGARSSRLTEKLRYESALASSVSASSPSLREAGLFTVQFESPPDTLAAAFGAVVSALNSLSADPPAPGELARAKALAAMGFLEGQDSPELVAETISSFELDAGDYRLKDAYLNLWSRIGARDLSELAAGIFVKERLVAAALLPEGAPELEAEALAAAASKLSPSAPRRAPAAGPAPFGETRLACGARLFAAKDSSRPLVKVSATVLGGRFAEEKGREGLVSLASSVWAKAAAGRSSPETARAVEDLGARVAGFSGYDTTGLGGTFLASSWSAGISLFSEILAEPSFAAEDFDRAKSERLAYIAGLGESLEARVFRLARRSLFGEHPYSKEYFGTRGSVSKLARQDAFDAWRRLARPEGMVFAVAGDLDPDRAARALDGALARWKPETSAFTPFAAPPAPPKPSGPAVSSEALDRAQAHMALSFLVPGRGSPDLAALDVLDGVLSGMGGVLATQLREKRPIAYSADSSHSPGMGTGSFCLYVACAPRKAFEALTVLSSVVGEARGAAYGDRAVADAKAYILGSSRIYGQSLGNRLADSTFYALLGMGQDSKEKYLAAIEAVTPEDVLRVAREHLDPGRAALSVVGNLASIKAAEDAFSKCGL